MAITIYEQIARQVLMTGDPTTGSDGRLYLDGMMTQAKLSEAIAEPIFVGEIFRDGQSVTSKYTVNAKPGDAVRVPLAVPFPSSSRTLAIGGRTGTTDNGGVINRNAPMLPTDDEFMVFLSQVNDQMILFPELSMNWLPVNKIAQRIGSYAETVVEDRSSSILAEILGYNIYRSLNGASNLNQIDITADGAYGTLLNELNTRLDNGDLITNAHAFPTRGRCIIGRPSFVNRMLNRSSGVILTGSDMAQSMLKEYNFDVNIAERDYVGNAYKGYTMGFDIQSANDYIWHRAEAYLGLAQGSLDNVLAVVVSFDANAASTNIDLGVKMVDHSGNPRGLEAQPLNCWGHEAFRLSQIVGDTSLTNDIFTALGFTDATRVYPIAPKDVFTATNSNQILIPIYGIDGTITGYQTAAYAPKPNGGNIQSPNGTFTVTNTLTHIASNGATTATAGTDYTATLTAASNYSLPSAISVVVGTKTLTVNLDYTYNSTTGALVIDGEDVLANIVITAAGVPDTYDSTATLTGCTATNTGTDVATYGVAYTSTITAAEGYTLPAALAAITVGGSAITLTTDYTYNSTTGVLTILAAKVTGDIAFTCVATN